VFERRIDGRGLPKQPRNYLSRCKKYSKQQKEKSKRESISGGKLTPIKPVMKTGRSEVKPLISPTSEFGLSSGSEEDGC
jgi:hypothetical protein